MSTSSTFRYLLVTGDMDAQLWPLIHFVASWLMSLDRISFRKALWFAKWRTDSIAIIISAKFVRVAWLQTCKRAQEYYHAKRSHYNKLNKTTRRQRWELTNTSGSNRSTVPGGPWEEHTATLLEIKLKGLRITPSLAFEGWLLCIGLLKGMRKKIVPATG